LGFLFYMQRTDGRLHNVLGYDRKYADTIGSEDSMGRTVWACGMLTRTCHETRLLACEIWDGFFSVGSTFASPWAKAFTMIGLYHYHEHTPRTLRLPKHEGYCGPVGGGLERESCGRVGVV
jgi:hypothetical protein